MSYHAISNTNLNLFHLAIKHTRLRPSLLYCYLFELKIIVVYKHTINIYNKKIKVLMKKGDKISHKEERLSL